VEDEEVMALLLPSFGPGFNGSPMEKLSWSPSIHPWQIGGVDEEVGW